MKYRIDKIDALLVVMLMAMDRNFVRCSLVDETADKELAVVNYNFAYPHPQVVFTDWAKESGWTKAFNKDWYIHDSIKEVLVAEGIVPGSTKVTPKQQQTQAPKQTTSQSAPKPQVEVGNIMKNKVKVSQATPKPQEKPKAEQSKQQPKVSFSVPKPSMSSGSFRKMTDEELAKELEFIVDTPDMNHDVDEDLLT